MASSSCLQSTKWCCHKQKFHVHTATQGLWTAFYHPSRVGTAQTYCVVKKKYFQIRVNTELLCFAMPFKLSSLGLPFKIFFFEPWDCQSFCRPSWKHVKCFSRFRRLWSDYRLEGLNPCFVIKLSDFWCGNNWQQHEKKMQVYLHDLQIWVLLLKCTVKTAEIFSFGKQN